MVITSTGSSIGRSAISTAPLDIIQAQGDIFGWVSDPQSVFAALEKRTG